MKPPEAAVRGLVLQWLEKAAADFDAAEQLCAQSGRFRAIVAFHCQQAAEKYLKALLVRHQIEFPKTHDIAKLLDRLATLNASIAESLCDAEVLTPFGVDVRYPSDAPEVLAGGETKALDIARQVRDAVRNSLRPYLDAGQARFYAADAAEPPRLFIMSCNTMGSFDPLAQIRYVAQCMKPGDRLIIDGELHDAEKTMPRRDNPSSRKFLSALLASVGISDPDGEIRFDQKTDSRHQGLHLITRYFRANRDLTAICPQVEEGKNNQLRMNTDSLR